MQSLRWSAYTCLGVRGWGLGIGVHVLGLRGSGLGFWDLEVWGLEFRVFGCEMNSEG